MDWLDLLAVQGTLKSLLQHHSTKASILQCSAFFIVQLSHPNMTTGKTIALTRQIFVGKIMSLLFNMLSRLVITFLPRSKHLLISWLQSHLQWLCIDIYNCYVFLLDWSLDHYVVSFLISCNLLYFHVYFFWYEDCYSSFLFLPICMECIFPSSHFQSICVCRSEVDFLQTAYIWVLFLYPISQSVLFVGALIHLHLK